MLMRSTVILSVLLLWPLSLPSAASAASLSLYGPFDQKHYGVRSEPASSPAYGALSGCGRGRYHDPESYQCKKTGRAALKAASVGDVGVSSEADASNDCGASQVLFFS
jgi:hypothetical protein